MPKDNQDVTAGKVQEQLSEITTNAYDEGYTDGFGEGLKSAEVRAKQEAYEYFREELARLSGRRHLSVLGQVGDEQNLYQLMITDEQQNSEAVKVIVDLNSAPRRLSDKRA